MKEERKKIATMQMPYSSIRILGLLKKDFPSVEERINKFFDSEEYKERLKAFNGKVMDEGIEFNYSMKEILAAMPVIEQKFKENMKLEIFFKAVARVFTEEDFTTEDMECYMNTESLEDIYDGLKEEYLKQIKEILLKIFQQMHKKH